MQSCQNKPGKLADLLIGLLETRLDNVVYKLGLGESRTAARQLVNHGFFQVNDKPVRIPSYSVKLGDRISFRTAKESRNYVKALREKLSNKKQDLPIWVELDSKKVEGKLVAVPKEADVNKEADIQAIVEFYSR